MIKGGCVTLPHVSLSKCNDSSRGAELLRSTDHMRETNRQLYSCSKRQHSQASASTTDAGQRIHSSLNDMHKCGPVNACTQNPVHRHTVCDL